MTVRRDLNGRLYTRPSPPQVWYLIDQGRRRPFSSKDVFNRLCDDDHQLIVSADIDGIDDGTAWPSDVEIVYCIENGETFVREGNVLRGIPSQDVMNLYHFKTVGDHGMHLSEILTYSGGAKLEGPVLVLPASLDQANDFGGAGSFNDHHKITTWITVSIDGADGKITGKTRIDNVHSVVGWTGVVEIILADVWDQPIYYHDPVGPSPGKVWRGNWTVNAGQTQEHTWTAQYPGHGDRFANLGSITIHHTGQQ